MMSSKKRALDPRTRGSKPSRPASVYTLRFLKYAIGDPSVAGTPQRTPSFDTIFFDLLNKFTVEGDVWLESDALSLCSLEIFTLLCLKFMLIGMIVKKGGEDDEMDDDDNDDDDAGSNDDKEVPKQLLPKLVSIVVALENVLAYADNLKTEVRWIHEVSRKFRAATRGIISSSKSLAASCVWASLEYFAQKLARYQTTSRFGTSVSCRSLPIHAICFFLAVRNRSDCSSSRGRQTHFAETSLNTSAMSVIPSRRTRSPSKPPDGGPRPPPVQTCTLLEGA